MHVSITPCIAGSYSDQKRGKKNPGQVVQNQFRVLADGQKVGVISTTPGSMLCLKRRFRPAEVAELEIKVGALLGREVVRAVQPPEVPADFHKPQEAEMEDF